MKLGLGNDRILKIFHKDAPDLYDVCSNLIKVCEDLNNSEARLHELDITVFTPFRPMLSLQCDSTVLNTEVTDDRTFYIENKFDGERFQLHMKDDIFKYFSKNGYEYTNIYGASYNSSGLLTPHLCNLFKNINSIILDGEMMGWNKKTNNFGSKGMSYDVKNLKSNSVHRPCFCVFDTLLYNKKVLTNVPLSERLQILDSFLIDIEGIIMKSKRTEVKTKINILNELNKSADNKEEGICFKDPKSIYKPNKRKGGWWKMKLEYFDDLMTELDILIIGGYYGEGKRQGLISSFLLAVAVPPDNPEESPTNFHSFAKVANGFTIEELDKLTEKLKPYWKIVDKNVNPEAIVWKKEKPDVWIDPRKSYILQIKASELTFTSEFQTEYTLRFPRVQRIRYDKPWYNCMTTTELNELTINCKAVVKLNNRHITTDDVEVSSKKRSCMTLNQVSIPTLNDKSPTSNLLQNKEICVFSGNELHTKCNIELKILENGGKIVQFDGPNTYCIIVDAITPRVRLLMSNSPRDIVKLDWFIRAMEHSSTKLLDWTPDDLISMSKQTKRKLSYRYDKYGDSYTKPVTRKELKTIFVKMMKEEANLNLMPKEMNEFDKILLYKNPLGVFRMCFAYFDKYANDDHTSKKNELLRNVEHDFRFFGGVQCERIEYHTTHIIGHSSDVSSVEYITQKIAAVHCINIKIVNENWLGESVLSGTLLDENMFALV